MVSAPDADYDIRRLRHGIERFLITDINNPAAGARASSHMPVLWDFVSTESLLGNHTTGGSNVLFMDGHVELRKSVPVHFSTSGRDTAPGQTGNTPPGIPARIRA